MWRYETPKWEMSFRGRSAGSFPEQQLVIEPTELQLQCSGMPFFFFLFVTFFLWGIRWIPLNTLNNNVLKNLNSSNFVPIAIYVRNCLGLLGKMQVLTVSKELKRKHHTKLSDINCENCRNKARWIGDSVCFYSPPTLGDLRNSMQRAQSTVGWTSALRKSSFWFAN